MLLHYLPQFPPCAAFPASLSDEQALDCRYPFPVMREDRGQHRCKSNRGSVIERNKAVHQPCILHCGISIWLRIYLADGSDRAFIRILGNQNFGGQYIGTTHPLDFDQVACTCAVRIPSVKVMLPCAPAGVSAAVVIATLSPAAGSCAVVILPAMSVKAGCDAVNAPVVAS